jgi:hypothetical protein
MFSLRHHVSVHNVVGIMMIPIVYLEQPRFGASLCPVDASRIAELRCDWFTGIPNFVLIGSFMKPSRVMM